MNSSFKVEDEWSCSPFNLGSPSMVTPQNCPDVIQPKRRSSSPLKLTQRQRNSEKRSDEIKIYIEPTLYVQRIVDASSKKLSGTIELLPVESHVLTITSEVITPQLLAKEEKVKKQQQAKQDEEESANNLKATKRRISSEQEQQQPEVKKPKVQPQTALPAALAAATPKVKLPTVPPPQHDTVLVRLTSGQVVRVPRALLKKVSAKPPVSTAPPPQQVVIRTQSHPQQLQFIAPMIPPPLPLAPLPQERVRKQSQPTILAKPPAAAIPMKKPAAAGTAQLPMQGKLSSVLKQLTDQPDSSSLTIGGQGQIILNGIMRKLAESGDVASKEVRAVKIRAFQGQKEAVSSIGDPQFGVGKLGDQVAKITKQIDPALAVTKAVSGVIRVTIPSTTSVTLNPTSSSPQKRITIGTSLLKTPSKVDQSPAKLKCCEVLVKELKLPEKIVGISAEQSDSSAKLNVNGAASSQKNEA